jgi:hypothetical protein
MFTAPTLPARCPLPGGVPATGAPVCDRLMASDVWPATNRVAFPHAQSRLQAGAPEGGVLMRPGIHHDRFCGGSGRRIFTASGVL